MMNHKPTAKASKPIGTNPKQFSDWKTLNAWQKSDIPPYTGIYRIRHAPNGIAKSRSLPTNLPDDIDPKGEIVPMSEARFQKLIHGLDLDGVLYVGKAVCHLNRFWLLIRTWQTNSGHISKSNHGSYNTWLKKNLQQSHPLAELEFRFVTLSDIAWNPETTTAAQEMSHTLWPQEGQNPDNPTVVASFAEENALLRMYLSFYTELPILNTAYPQRDQISKKKKDAWMEKHLDDLAQNASNEPQTEIDLGDE